MVKQVRDILVIFQTDLLELLIAKDVNLGGESVSQVAMGGARYTSVTRCALNTSGQVKCWGEGDYGFQGYGDAVDIGQTNEPSVRPYHDFGEKIVQISGTSHNDRDHYCVLTESSRIYCWGYGGDGGNLNVSTNNIGLNKLLQILLH